MQPVKAAIPEEIWMYRHRESTLWQFTTDYKRMRLLQTRYYEIIPLRPVDTKKEAKVASA